MLLMGPDELRGCLLGMFRPGAPGLNRKNGGQSHAYIIRGWIKMMHTDGTKPEGIEM